MMRRILGLAACGIFAAFGAVAQTSLFDQPVAKGMQIARPKSEANTAPAAPKAKPKKVAAKPKGPAPARSILVSNASKTTLTDLEVAADGQSTKLSGPLAPDASATLNLPALKGCTVTMTASFEGAAEPDTSSYDICKAKSIRFTD